MNDQEILEALKKSVAMPPVLCMNERSVVFVDCYQAHYNKLIFHFLCKIKEVLA